MAAVLGRGILETHSKGLHVATHTAPQCILVTVFRVAAPDRTFAPLRQRREGGGRAGGARRELPCFGRPASAGHTTIVSQLTEMCRI